MAGAAHTYHGPAGGAEAGGQAEGVECNRLGLQTGVLHLHVPQASSSFGEPLCCPIEIYWLLATGKEGTYIQQTFNKLCHPS